MSDAQQRGMRPAPLTRFRGGTAEQWAFANPVLESREPGFETDTNVLKVGDGATPWSDLESIGSGGGGNGGGGGSSLIYRPGEGTMVLSGGPADLMAGDLNTVQNANATGDTIIVNSDGMLEVVVPGLFELSVTNLYAQGLTPEILNAPTIFIFKDPPFAAMEQVLAMLDLPRADGEDGASGTYIAGAYPNTGLDFHGTAVPKSTVFLEEGETFFAFDGASVGTSSEITLSLRSIISFE